MKTFNVIVLASLCAAITVSCCYEHDTTPTAATPIETVFFTDTIPSPGGPVVSVGDEPWKTLDCCKVQRHWRRVTEGQWVHQQTIAIGSDEKFESWDE